MRISILHPSFGRPEMAVNTASKWINKMAKDYPTQIEYILCLSHQDPLKKKYETFFSGTPATIIYHPHANMVKQVNLAAQLSKGDLLINVSDDFDCPQDWDRLLTESVAGLSDYTIKVDDGIRVDGINSANIIALPIMDRTYYNRFGYIYHPDYGHFFGDEENSNVADMLGKKITLPIVFEHVHYTMGKAKEDATNKKNNRHFEKDKETFKLRKANNFGL